MQDQLDKAFEEIEEVRFILQALKESIEKQPFYSAPTTYEILEALSEFVRNDLNKCISSAEKAQEIIENIDVEEVA